MTKIVKMNVRLAWRAARQELLSCEKKMLEFNLGPYGVFPGRIIEYSLTVQIMGAPSSKRYMMLIQHS